MKIAFSDNEWNKAKSNDKLPLYCLQCNNIFYKEKVKISRSLSGSTHKKYIYCTPKCLAIHNTTSPQIQCTNCHKLFFKFVNQFKKSKSGNHFCTRSCAANYNNLHKQHGTKRSKLEHYLEKQLLLEYPNIEFHFNRKDAINSELDIYIPSLRLAFELNGIFHYEPIYGKEKLSQIKNNDHRKFQACLERGIELCIIDVSTFKHFKEHRSDKYLQIITNIINVREEGFEPTRSL